MTTTTLTDIANNRIEALRDSAGEDTKLWAICRAALAFESRARIDIEELRENGAGELATLVEDYVEDDMTDEDREMVSARLAAPIAEAMRDGD